MKKVILFVAVVFAAFTTNAQFYVSASGGYSLGTGEKVLGTNTSLVTTGLFETDIKGSYGEGVHTQIRGGYFFNDKLGFELGLGYLYGMDQDVSKIDVPGVQANIKARGRAFGASLSAIYNVTNNFYARAGLLTKIGGKTEAITNLEMEVPAQALNPLAPAGLTLPLNAEFTTNFDGKFPTGFIGALGYKFPIADNWSLFAEVEYMAINVTRDVSNAGDFSATLNGGTIDKATLTQILSSNAQLAPLTLLYADDEIKWGENGLPQPNAPYSSLGFNFGITYTFN